MAATRADARRAGGAALLVALVPLLLTLRTASFAMPPAQVRGAPAAERTRGLEAAADASELRRVEELEVLSLEACMLASEDDPDALQRCSELSYQLQEAEAELMKRRVEAGSAPLAAADSDSY